MSQNEIINVASYIGEMGKKLFPNNEEQRTEWCIRTIELYLKITEK